MHDEDNELGLIVKDPAGDVWTAYGDGKLLAWENNKNMDKCHSALTESIDEIYTAWKTGVVPQEADFKAWKHAPVIKSAFEAPNHCPIFNEKGERRSKTTDTHCTEYTTNFWHGTTAIDLGMRGTIC